MTKEFGGEPKEAHRAMPDPISPTNLTKSIDTSSFVGVPSIDSSRKGRGVGCNKITEHFEQNST